jgi:Protein of unknown function (DUF2924)
MEFRFIDQLRAANQPSQTNQKSFGLIAPAACCEWRRAAMQPAASL